MKTAIFWGTPGNCYQENPIMCDSDSTGAAGAEMIEDYISNSAPYSSDSILGVWDPVLSMDDDEISDLTIEQAYDSQNRFKDESLLPTIFYFAFYSKKKEQFGFDEATVTDLVKIIYACAGWGDNPSQKKSFRLGLGLSKALSALKKKEKTQLIKMKIIAYLATNLYAPGEFWKHLQEKYGIDALIIASPIHHTIIGDRFFVSCDHLPKIRATTERGTKLVTYQIDSALVSGLKMIADRDKKSLTDVFSAALMG